MLDRRHFLLASGGTLLVACSGAAMINRQDTSSNGADGIKAIGIAPPPKTPDPIWTAFKGSFVQPDGRVVDTGNNGISHSEGQGYAMILAANAADRDAFDRMFAWTEKTLVRPADGLFSWRYDPRGAVPVSDPNNASDGDMLIAWALMLGAARWRESHLSERAASIRAMLHEKMLHHVAGQTYLLPGVTGFVHDTRVTLNPSYYVWPALKLFRAADGGAKWDPVIRGGQTLLTRARFGPHNLPTDWVDVAPDGRMAPAKDRPPRFGFDAIRVPLYLSMVDQRRLAEPIARYWRSFGARPIPAWVDVQTGETAPYSLSSGAMAVMHRLLGSRLTDPMPQSDYYASVLHAFAVMQTQR